MSPSEPRFTILLPTHNRPDVLPLAIASVLAQTERDFELLIVADGCEASTAKVVQGFSDPRIHFFDLPKAPHFGYANRNVALRQARGKYVAFAAHDDLWLPDHLELMGRLLDQTGVSWAYSRPLWVSTDGVIIPLTTNLLLPSTLRHFLGGSNTIPAGCVVHTREALEQAGYWPEEVRFMGDWTLWTRILGQHHNRLAHLRIPTQLHFSARWKNSRHARVPQVKYWLSIADQHDWWPAHLRYAVGTGHNAQQVIWEVMQQDGLAWSQQLREEVDTAVDRVAGLYVYGLQPGWERTPVFKWGKKMAQLGKRFLKERVLGRLT